MDSPDLKLQKDFARVSSWEIDTEFSQWTNNEYQVSFLPNEIATHTTGGNESQ